MPGGMEVQVPESLAGPGHSLQQNCLLSLTLERWDQGPTIDTTAHRLSPQLARETFQSQRVSELFVVVSQLGRARSPFQP